MNKSEICEVMYALPDGVVVKRRKPMLVPALLLVAGVAMLVLNNLYGVSLTNNLRSSVVFVGGALALAGMVLLAARMFGSDGVPFHKNGRCYLLYDELYFDRTNRGEVMRSIAEGKIEPLLTMNHAHVPALTVAVYRTPDNHFAAMQAFEYADLEYRAVTELKIVGV